jgi:Fe-S-cluster containining protein
VTENDRKLEAIYADLPDVPCTGQCYQSCSFIATSEAEHQRIRRERGIAIEMYQTTCPALDFAGRCSIHELRPLICRVYGATERLRCPYGCIPERWLADTEVYGLLKRAEAIAGPHDEEGSKIVAAALRAIDPTLGEPKCSRR